MSVAPEDPEYEEGEQVGDGTYVGEDGECSGFKIGPICFNDVSGGDGGDGGTDYDDRSGDADDPTGVTGPDGTPDAPNQNDPLPTGPDNPFNDGDYYDGGGDSGGSDDNADDQVPQGPDNPFNDYPDSGGSDGGDSGGDTGSGGDSGGGGGLDGSGDHTIRLIGRRDARTEYSFSVSGDVGRLNRANSHDTISGSTVSGRVYNSGAVDNFEFTGEITDISFNGADMRVEIDGQQMSQTEILAGSDGGSGDTGGGSSGGGGWWESAHTITIAATGEGTTNYQISAERLIDTTNTEDETNGEDAQNGSVTGSVSGDDVDQYFWDGSGDAPDLAMDGEAQVTIDGQSYSGEVQQLSAGLGLGTVGMAAGAAALGGLAYYVTEMQ